MPPKRESLRPEGSPAFWLPKVHKYRNLLQLREDSRKAFDRFIDIVPEADQDYIRELHNREWTYMDLKEARYMYAEFKRHIASNVSQMTRQLNGKERNQS